MEGRALGAIMKDRSIRLTGAAFIAAATLAAAPCAQAADLPDYLKAISGTTAPAPVDLATKNVLQLNISMFGLYDNAGRVFRKNILDRHPLILALFTGAGGRMILYKPGPAASRRPLGAARLPGDEVARPQHHGDLRGRHALPRECRRQDLGGADARLPQRDEERARRHRPGRHAGRLAARLARHPREQHRLHGRLPRQGRHLLRRAAGLRPESRGRLSGW